VAARREAEGRERKVDALVVGVSMAGLPASRIARFTDADWDDLTKSLGLKRRPSGLTRRIVVERLAGGSHERALCPTCGLGDPEGEPGPRKPFGHEGGCAR
jgi:hypothetical protein